MNKDEQKGIIHYLSLKHYTVDQIHQELQKVAEEDAYSISEIYYWINEIKNGRKDLANIKPTWRQLDPTIRSDIKEYIEEHPSFSAREIAKGTKHLLTTVCKVLHQEMGYKYLHLHKVPYVLDDDL